MSEPLEAEELARRICSAARDKVDATEVDNKRIETPFQRKYKKEFGEIVVVSIFLLSTIVHCLPVSNPVFAIRTIREVKKMTSRPW